VLGRHIYVSCSATEQDTNYGQACAEQEWDQEQDHLVVWTARAEQYWPGIFYVGQDCLVKVEVERLVDDVEEASAATPPRRVTQPTAVTPGSFINMYSCRTLQVVKRSVIFTIFTVIIATCSDA
jgi:hypothetical protein